MLSLVRHLPQYNQDVRAGAWHASPFFCRLDYPITELNQLTLGIVGYGNLGQATAALAQALGMTVQVAEHQGQSHPREGRVPFETCLQDSDIVTLHCPLTEKTQGLIGDKELALIGQSGYLINTARGALVDEPALADALADGRLAGAALDVLSEEPPSGSNPLLTQQPGNLLITPHCAWGSLTARRQVVAQTAANIRAFAVGELVRVVV
jgi:glycerate dehydrogenase